MNKIYDVTVEHDFGPQPDRAPQLAHDVVCAVANMMRQCLEEHPEVQQLMTSRKLRFDLLVRASE